MRTLWLAGKMLVISHVGHCVSLRDLRKVLTCRIGQHVCEESTVKTYLIDIVTVCVCVTSFPVFLDDATVNRHL